ncbi:ArnT family glycosyltransferase [Micromonospora sp. NPDC049900]|uniref:ArnT family glycosyltransferase n=1 Tax=Micromonospora sp. NPDC049900 TaxID=3364275 RepID=UPI0037A00F5D
MVVPRAGSQSGRQRGRGWLRLDRPAFVALLLGLAGVGYRLYLVLHTVPVSNSDEATFGLAALHIAEGREHPVFLYGQRYMGMLQSYLAAPLLAVGGPSWPLLRLPVLALYAVFLWLIHRLTRRIGSPWFATLVVGLLALGSERVIRDQVTTVGGRPEVKVAVLAMLLLVAGLAQGTVRHRRLAVGVFGLLAGVAVWSDWLIVPYLAVAGLALVWAVRRELLGGAGLLLLVGFAVGIAPMIRDNLVAPPGQDSLSVLRTISGGTAAPPPWAQRLDGGLLEGVSLAGGLCPLSGCARWQEWFGLLYPVLLVVAAVLAGLAYRRGAGRADRLAPVLHLALLGGAALTLLAYVRSSLAATDPLGNARYLSVLQLSMPAVLWPLWSAAVAGARGAVGAWRRLVGAVATAVLAALAATSLVVTVLFATAGADPGRREERYARQLAATVHAAGLHEVYGEYWTCNRLIFNTAEKVVCGVLDGELHPGQNRYPKYWWRLARATRPGYVLAAGAPADRRLRELLGDRADGSLLAEIGGFRVYHPPEPLRPWR